MTVIHFSEIQIKSYIEKIRPPQEIRDEVDVWYSFKNNIIEIFEIRPDWNDENIKINLPIARTRYNSNSKKWRIYWINSQDKWLPYKPNPEVSKFSDFIEILKKDKNNCFWG